MKYCLILLSALLVLSCEDGSPTSSKKSSGSSSLIGAWVGVEFNEYFYMDGKLVHDDHYTWDPYTTTYSQNDYVTFLSESRLMVYSYADELIPEYRLYSTRGDSIFIQGAGLWGTFRFSGDTLIINDIMESGGDAIWETSYVQYSGDIPGIPNK